MDTSQLLQNFIIFIVAYLIGSLSPSILITKLNNVDIRNEGSKNAGSTNVLRVMGPKFGLCVFILDVLKGALVTLVSLLIFGYFSAYLASVAVVFGHIFSVFHKFKAGKGVAPAIGVAFVIDWRLGLCALVFGVILIFITRRVSVGSICAAIALPFLTWIFCPDFIIFSLIIAILVVFMHRSNIKRLVYGQEKPIF